MRGKDTAGKVEILAPGITPAYAGKRNPVTSLSYSNRDHPRLCGEKLKNYAIVGIEGGSPPPMRGKGQVAIDNKTFTRITPAYAGKRKTMGWR